MKKTWKEKAKELYEKYYGGQVKQDAQQDH